MIGMSASDIAAATGATLLEPGSRTVTGEAVIDSRRVGDGSLFVAFVGERGEVLLVCRGLAPGRVRAHRRARCVIERPAREGEWLEEGEHLWVSAVSADGVGAL